MKIIEWDDTYSVGIDQFDGQHKHLLNILNDAYAMFKSKESDKGKLSAIIQSLSDYTADHFSQEEAWMLEKGYPKRDEHILEHGKFIGKISEFDHHFREDTAYLSMGIVMFLKDWLIQHILKNDAEYSEFYRLRQQ